MTKLVAIVAMVSLTGCSLFLTRGPSDDRIATGGTAAAAQKAPPDCTTSMMWPTVDGVVAGVITLALIAGISSKNEADRPDSDAVTSGFIVAGAAGVSGLIGHSRVTKCRRTTETYTAQTYGSQQNGYAGYAYPQQGYPQQGYPQQYPPPYQQGYTYPQQYPAPQQYPPPQYPAPQQPVAQPQTPPINLNPPIPKQPPARPPAPKTPPLPKAPDPILGIEGDVCTAAADCGAGLACTGNVCVKK